MIKAVAFDFDGVILESVGVKDQAIYDLFQDASPEEKERVLELHRDTPGIDRRSRMELLLTQALGRFADNRTIEYLLGRFSRLVWEGLMSCPEVPGIREFLDLLQKSGVPCYVVSAAPGEEVREVAKARDFSKYFEAILGTPGSKSEFLRDVLQATEIQAAEMLFIGDKISDCKAAHLVGANFVGRQLEDNATVFPEETITIENFEQSSTHKIIAAYFA